MEVTLGGFPSQVPEVRQLLPDLLEDLDLELGVIT